MSKRTCSIPGCSGAHVAHGLCGPHYRRAKRDAPFPKKSLVQRFEEKVRLGEGDCWQWVGSTTSAGYGMKWDGDRVIPAHRWSYEYHRAPIPVGLVLDHLCRNTSCVNPWHLEPVTNQVNTQRGKAGDSVRARAMKRTHCPYGHEFTPENTYKHARGDRQCRTCRRARDRVARMLAAS